ncbi:gamma-aminobutyric acid receptor subunit beta-like, partial [Symsagittifera roscoffensis]
MVQTGENNAQAEPDDEEPDGVLVLRCNVKRKFNYFLYNCFLVMLFFAVMSMCNFANKPENVQFRLAGTLTLVLTSVAYKLMLSNSLPTISYLTLVDVYVLFSVFMLTFLVVAFAVLHTVYRHFTCCLEEEELVHLAFRLDIITMAVLAGIHVMWNLSFGLYAFHKTRQVTDKLKEDEAIYAEKLS